MNFVDARRRRRKIVVRLQEQQAAEAACSQRLRDIAIQSKRELLTALANWLQVFDETRSVGHDEKTFFDAIRFPIGQWQELQLCIKTQQRQLEVAGAARQSADATYRDAAPFGPISRWFMADTDRNNLERLQAECSRAKSDYRKCEADYGLSMQQFSTLCEEFLRSCTTADISQLAKNPLSDIVNPLVSRSGALADEIWSQHRLQQSKTITDVIQTCDALGEFYSTQSPGATGGPDR